MTENKTKRKERIKSIAIIFLAVMLALTFFSKTILNWSLPEVSGQYCGYGQLTSSIRGSGIVSANMGYSVTINESRTIREILVRREDRVEAGQVLFVLEEGDSAELEAAKETLYDMENALRLAKLNASVSATDSISDDIAELKAQLAEAKAKLAALEAEGITEEMLEELKKGVKESESEIEALAKSKKESENQIGALENRLNEISSGEAAAENEAVKAAQLTYEEAKEQNAAAGKEYEQLSTLQSDIESYQSSITANEKRLNELLVQRAEAERTYNYKHPMQFAYKNAVLQVKNAQTKLENLPPDTDDSTREAVLNELLAAQAALNSIVDNVGTVTDDEMNALSEQLIVYKDDIYYITQELEEAKAMLAICNPEGRELLEVKLDAAKAKQHMRDTAEALEQAEKALSQAQEQYKQESKGVAEELKNSVDVAKEELDALSRQQEDAASRKEELEKQLGTATETLAACKEARTAVTSLEKSVAARQKDLANAQKQSSIEAQRTAIELEKQEREVEKQRNAVAALEARKGGTEVTAKYPGTVTSVNIMVGDKVTPDTTLATIGVEDKGYTLTMSVTNEQAARLGIGDKASVKNWWWGNIDVTLTSIQIDRAQQGRGKILEFSVSGDVTDGQSLELVIGERNTSYNTVVPNSAMHEDSNGKFVLVAEAKSTPLGNRYIATRVDVTEIDKDNYNTAIDIASEYNYSYVITTATKPIDAGMQVRLAEGQA